MKIELDEYCPCCGYDTFEGEERLQYIICPICFWEDDPIQFSEPEYEGGANRVSLVQAQRNFEEFRACEREMIRHTRKPKESDVRKSNWLN
ncbi:CPCC family cysteine-rich protein [Pontibacter brevis]